MTLSILGIKLISISLLFVLSIVFGLIPYFIKNSQNKKEQSKTNVVLSFCNSFSGGVFLGAGMLHLFSDSTIGLNIYSKRYNNYPISSLCLCFGFLFIFFLEILIHKVMIRISKPDSCTKSTSISSNRNLSTVEDSDQEALLGSNYSTSNNDNFNNINHIDNSENINYDNHHSNHNSIGHGHNHDISIQVKDKFIPYILVTGLSVHSLFEGIALGVQNTQVHILDILVAIFAHKFLASFALGVNIVQSRDDKTSFLKVFSLIMVFSIASPVGSIIGLMVSNLNCALVSSILQGIASGTFLYISVIEIIPREINHDSKHLLPKSILLLLGFSIMAVAAYWI